MTRTEALPWQRALHDRGSERRSAPGFLAGLAAEPRLLFLPLSEGKAWFSSEGLGYFGVAELEAAGIDAMASLAAEAPGNPAPAVYLGQQATQGSPSRQNPPSVQGSAGSDVVALPLSEAGAAALSNVMTGNVMTDTGPRMTASAAGRQTAPGWYGFRQIAGMLSVSETQYLIEALGVLNWHRTHTHCPRCGSATCPENAGWTRRCPHDGSEHFPRMDPAIIVTVTGPDGRLLLGNGAGWEPHRFSTLAGFVEPGESLEQAVVREVFEEVGVRVQDVQYLGSQPWPFPSSLMLGFTATTDDAEARLDGLEMVAARWFSRTELADAVGRGEIVISHRMSIARALIEQWYGGVIEEPGRV